MQVNVIKRAIISGGGTGGHIFPALSIADALRRRYPDIEILFIGADGRMEMSRVPQAGYKIIGLPVQGLLRTKIWRNVGVVWRYLRSLVMARDIIKEFRPDVVVGVGGYASAPTLKAAQSLGIPTLIQEQNSYAGVTNKYLARRATCICVAYPDMERFFPKECIVLTGNPIRAEIEYGRPTRLEALAHFGLPEDTQRVVLVVGGSLGARTINESIASEIDRWIASGVTLIWQTGIAYADTAQALLSTRDTRTIYCAPFIDRMADAYALADVVVSRAGASSISELCLLAKPSILVPSPNVAEDHQTKNAMALSTRGAAILIPDREAVARLTDTALELVHDEVRLSALSSSVATLAKGEAAERIVDELQRIIPRVNYRL